MTNKVDQKTIRSHNLVQWVNEILHWYSKGYRPLTHTIRNMGVQNIIVMEGVVESGETEVLVGLEADENATSKVGTDTEAVETKTDKPVTVKTTRTKKVTKDEN